MGNGVEQQQQQQQHQSVPGAVSGSNEGAPDNANGEALVGGCVVHLDLMNTPRQDWPALGLDGV